MGALARAYSLRQLQERRRIARSVQRLSFRRGLMPHQSAFIDDPALQKALGAGRRAGKSETAKPYLLQAVMSPETVAKRWVKGIDPPVARYWAPTRMRARDLMFRPLVRFCHHHGIPIKANETLLTITVPGGGEIRCVGADKDVEAQKKRGDKTVLEVVDEASVYGVFFESMLQDVIMPSLLDYTGVIVVMGTPGVIWEGAWYHINGPGGKLRKAFSQHHFDPFNNTYIPHLQAEIEAERVRNGWAKDSPTYLRERRGQWVKDTGALYFHWSDPLNIYRRLPQLSAGKEWDYSLGWDLGNPENMALVLWAFAEGDPYLYEVHSRQGFDKTEDIADTIEKWDEAVGGIAYRVADFGGVGGVVVDQFEKRHGISFEEARKTDKFGHVVLFNEDLRAGRIKTRPGSMLSKELATLPKDAEDPKEPDDRFPDHCSMAGLYAWRRAWHWETPNNEDKEEAKDNGSQTDEAIAEQEEQQVEEELEADDGGWRYG